MAVLKVLSKVRFLVALLVGTACSSLALGGEETLYQPCAACHGSDARGNSALGAPALAGQQQAYLQRQLLHFREGRRGADAADTYGLQMRSMSLALTDDQISALSQYLSAMPPAAVATATKSAGADLRNGNDYYQAKCGACHGGSAEGNKALNSPNLAILDAAYLKRQFMHFQTGLRGSAEGDRFGRQMQLMSTTLPLPNDLDDVVAFINALAPE